MAAGARDLFRGLRGPDVGDRIGTVDPARVVHSCQPGVIERLFNTHGVEEAKVKPVAGHANAGKRHECYYRGYAPRMPADTIGARSHGIGDEQRAQVPIRV